MLLLELFAGFARSFKVILISFFKDLKGLELGLYTLRVDYEQFLFFLVAEKNLGVCDASSAARRTQEEK